MNIVKGNILHVKEGFITQQVNGMGIAGAGLALQIAQMYPKWKDSYIQYCRKYGKGDPSSLLGKVHYAQRDNLIIASIFGQVRPGRGVMTQYGALGVGLRDVGTLSKDKGLPLYIPYKIGCGLAGGDWTKVSSLIEAVCPHAIIVQL